MTRAEIAYQFNALLYRGEADAAEKLVARGRELVEGAENPNEFYLAWFALDLAFACNAKGEPERALRALSQAKELFTRTMGSDHVYTKLAQLNEVESWLQQGEIAKASAQLEHLRPWYAQHLAAGRHAQAEWMYAMVLNAQGRYAASLEHLNTVTTDFLEAGGFDKASAKYRLSLERAIAQRGMGQLDVARTTLAALNGAEAGSSVWPWEIDRAKKLRMALAR